MKITFLGQGFLPTSGSSVGEHLMKFLLEDDFHSFTAFSAFASEGGIVGLSSHFLQARQKFRNLTLVVGVDKNGTSQEALMAILNLEIDSFVFHQPQFPIFHPKVYLFEGEQRTELIIGSSNLTTQGLFLNVEASLLVSIENENVDDRKVVEDLKAYFKGLFNRVDPNLQPLSHELIEELAAKNMLPTEKERQVQHDKSEEIEKEAIPSLYERLFPKRVIAKISKEFKRTRKTRSSEEKLVPISTIIGAAPTLGELVWVKNNVPKSDVQVPGRGGTNPTGGLRLTQSKYRVNGTAIDQTVYFRELFKDFRWKVDKRQPYSEVALIPFEIAIKGKFIGKFNLAVHHKPSGEAGQHNYTTLISWGKADESIRQSNLIGTTLQLFRPSKKGGAFHIRFE